MVRPASCRSQRAEADMWWVIVGAVIALIVAGVLIAVFSSRAGPAQQSLASCEQKGGICSVDECPQGTLLSSAFSCSGSAICCLGLAQGCNSDGDCDNGVCKQAGRKSYCYDQ